MPDLSTTITDDVIALKKAYEGISKSWYRRWFFPSALAKALNDYHPEAANALLLPIVNAMWQNVRFFHKWLFPSIATFSDSTLMQQADGFQITYSYYLSRDIVKTNFNDIIRHNKPQDLAVALSLIYNHGLFSTEQGQANYCALIQHNDPRNLAWAFGILNRTGLLNAEQGQANLEALIKINNPTPLGDFMLKLRQVGLITRDNAQDIFDALIRHADVLLNNRVYNICHRIPNHLWTLGHFTHFVNICSLDEMSIEQRIRIIQRYVNEVILRGHNDRQAFNPSQSTHTASVHESVSESAKRLINRYPLTAKQLLLPSKALKEWGTSLVDTDLKTLAAKRAIIRITANDYDAFTDSTSGVSMKQLLALAWTAMNDVDNLVMGASAQEAKNRFLQCLYEIQRGYNIDEQGNDDHQDDKPICTAGTFNKLIEALSGIHQDCHIVMLSIPQASAKLPIIVREEALKYIEANNDINKEEYSQQLEQHGLMMIITAGITLWEAIKANVIYRVKDEFGFLFKEKDALEAFVDNGKETNCQLLQNALSNAGHPHRFFQPQPAETSSSSSSRLSPCQG